MKDYDENEGPYVPEYTIFACVIQNRVYRVQAASSDDAMDLVRDEYNYLEHDILDDEVENVTLEE